MEGEKEGGGKLLEREISILIPIYNAYIRK